MFSGILNVKAWLGGDGTYQAVLKYDSEQVGSERFQLDAVKQGRRGLIKQTAAVI